MTRARVVVLDNQSVALIERNRDGAHYYVFPGGGIEGGESAEQAAIREVHEEIGLDVAIERHLATVERRGEIYLFFLARPREAAAAGEFRPVWLPVATLPNLDVRPVEIATLLVQAADLGWPEPPPSLSSDGRPPW